MTDKSSLDFTQELRFGATGLAGMKAGGLAALEARVRANPLDRAALEAVASHARSRPPARAR
jgi:hypothetical protein